MWDGWGWGWGWGSQSVYECIMPHTLPRSPLFFLLSFFISSPISPFGFAPYLPLPFPSSSLLPYPSLLPLPFPPSSLPPLSSPSSLSVGASLCSFKHCSGQHRGETVRTTLQGEWVDMVCLCSARNNCWVSVNFFANICWCGHLNLWSAILARHNRVDR